MTRQEFMNGALTYQYQIGSSRGTSSCAHGRCDEPIVKNEGFVMRKGYDSAGDEIWNENYHPLCAARYHYACQRIGIAPEPFTLLPALSLGL